MRTEQPPSAGQIDHAVDVLRSAERHVELSHGDVRYFEVGEGRPVILLHGIGFTAGGTNWLLNLEDLARHRRVLAPDLLGFGPGPRLQQPFSFAYLVDFIREFQDALGLTMSDLVGHSMGGWVASLFAYESPERVGRLILVAPGGVIITTPPAMRGFNPPTRESILKEVAGRLGLSVETVGPLADLEWQVVTMPGAPDAYRRLLEHMSDPETRRRYQTRRRLPMVHAETLVLWGEHDDVNDPRSGQLIADLVPHCQLMMLPCGHGIPTEAPKQFNEIVSRFLEAGLTSPDAKAPSRSPC